MMLHRFIEPYLRQALADMGVSEDHPIGLEVPKQEGQGDLATPIAMTLARPLKKAPKEIAEEIAHRLAGTPMVKTVDVAGPGFINVTFDRSVYQQILGELLMQGDDIGRSGIGVGKTVNVEYVSANPTGPLHAGHGRNCAVGDTVANLYSWCGYEVVREYYFNNAGNQMNKLGESVLARVMQHLGQEDWPFPEDGYHGEYISNIARMIVDSDREGFLGLPEADKHEFCRKTGEKWCFESIKQTLHTLGISHDVFYNESDLYSEGKVAAVVDALRARDLVYEKDGATWFALEQLGNPQDKVIIKATGEPTYRLPDIAYHKEKLDRGYDLVVDIFGADHIATIPDVLAGVKALGFDDERVKTVIHQMVTFIENGEVVKFSKRSGTSFSLDELIDDVGADVVRFFFIMRAVGTHLEFDLDLAKEEGEKNPVFYLQYAHARICSILRKAQEQGVVIDSDIDLGILTHPKEIRLIDLLSRFQVTVERSCIGLEPHAVAEYLRELAAAYHHFYHECRILGSEENVQGARLVLADVARRAMRNGLQMLGVAAPTQM